MKKIISLLILVSVVGIGLAQGQTSIGPAAVNEKIVTGTQVLKDGHPGATGQWLDMPLGTCDVTLWSEAGGLSHASGNYSYSLSAAQDATATKPGTQFCSSNGNWWTACTRTLKFDEQFSFLHLSGPGDVIYIQIAYKCKVGD